MSPIRTPLHDLLAKLRDDLAALGYDMLTPTSPATGYDQWTIEVRRQEEPIEINWSYPDLENMRVGLRGVQLTPTQIRSLRGYLDSLLDDDPPPVCTCIERDSICGGTILMAGIEPCPVHVRPGDRFYG